MEECEDIEDNEFFFSHVGHAPRMPDDDIIMSGVANLTGGRDQHGRPIIAFPAKYHGILESKVKASGMETLLRYFIDITRAADRKRGFAFVTDLRFSTLDFILLLKSILNSIQAEMQGAIGSCVLYVILPLNKRTHKDTLTHLALRQSKKKINKNLVPPYFQSVAVEDEMELYNYIEKSHLAPELGGYLQYSHQDWVAFRRIVEPFFANFESVQVRLPNVYQRLTAMANVTLEKTKEQLQETHNQLQDVCYDIKRSLHLDEILEHCEKLLPRFSSCDEEDVFAALAQKPIFKETKETVEACYEILMAARRKIDDDWNNMSRRINQALQLIDYRTDVNKLLDWFKSKRERDLQHGADIADNLSRAELLCNHYQTGLLVKAEEKLSKVNGLVQQGETMAVDDNSHRVIDIMTLTKTLKDESQVFRNAMQKHQHILQSVYHFHQLYNKARRWYVKCIKFLPSDLQDLLHDLRSHSGHDNQALRLQWEGDVRRFLHKNPLLVKEELKKVKMIPEEVGATVLKKKGHLLSYRCLILTNLLSHTDKTSTAHIKDIMKWRSEIHNKSDDPSSYQSEVSPSSDHIRKAQSDSSLDTSHQSHRHKKPDSKRQNRSAPQKNTAEKEDSHRRSTQTQERTRKHNRHRDRYSDTNSNTMNETDDEDPLISRLGKAGSFYDRYGDTQGRIMDEGQDEVDDGKQEDSRRNSNRMHSGVADERGQPSPTRQQYIPVYSDHSPTPQTAMDNAQTYGIYGDSDFEDDTAVVIHHQGPSHLPQGLPIGSMDPSNIVLGNQSRYGLNQQDSHQSQPDYRTCVHPSSSHPSTPLSTQSVYQQHGPATQHIHQSGIPAYLNANNSNTTTSQSPHTVPHNHQHPSLSPLQGSYVNDMSSPRGEPISFHGSLMNIHQSQHGLSAMGGGTEHAEVTNSSQVSKYRSLMDLSQSPIMDQAGIVQNMQSSPVRAEELVDSPQSAVVTSLAMESGEMYPFSPNLPNPQHSIASSRLKHGMSEPNLNTSPHDNSSSPYSAILDSLNDLQARSNTKPAQSRLRLPKHRQSKKTAHFSSQRALSHSEMDLRYIPQNLSLNGPLHSEHALHQSEVNLRQTVPNSHRQSQSIVLPTQNASCSGSSTDPQVEYYKKLYSTSTPNQSTAASGNSNTNHTLDPSVHTWMHDIRSPQTRLFERLHSMPHPLSPLALLEMEVAKETMNAEEAIQEDGYNEEQARRQVVIDNILDQSEPSIRSHVSTFQNDRRATSQEQMTLSNGYRGKMSEGRHRQGRSDIHNSSRKVDNQMLRNSSPKRYPSPQPEATSTKGPGLSQFNKSKHLPSSHKADVHVLHSQKGNLISENGWREQHQGIVEQTASGTQNASPTSVHIQSIITPTSTERQLGLSSTLPQPAAQGKHLKGTEHNHGVTPSESLSHPQRHSPYTTVVSLDKPQSASPSERHDSKVDWRQEHLRELGLSPAAGLSVGRFSVKEGFTPSKPISTSVSSTNWRRQHLQDLGISPSMQHSSLQQDSPIEVPHTVSLSESDSGDWRHQHLLELGISPSMHHCGLNQDSVITEPIGRLAESKNGDWRQQHLSELGISPSRYHSVSNQTPFVGRGKAADISIESDSDWRRNHLNDLGISPSMHHYPVPRSATPGGSAGNIAPVTSRLRGVIGSGQNLNDMEEIHQLADETTKKSVRFAHVSDVSVLDTEEQAQDELALRLHQLELKFEEEANSLKHQDVLYEEATLAQHLRELDQQEDNMQVHVRDVQIGHHQVLLGGAVRPVHNENNQHEQASAWPGHQPQRLQNSQYVQVSACPDQQVLVEGTIQPVHVQNSQHIDLQHMLEGAVPLEHVQSKSPFLEDEKRTGTDSYNPQLIRSKHVAQNGHPIHSSFHETNASRSDRINRNSYSKPSQNITTEDCEIRESVDLVDAIAHDPTLAHSVVQSHTETDTNIHNHRMCEPQSKGSSSVCNDRVLGMSTPTGLESNPSASDTPLAGSRLRTTKTSKQFSLSKDTPHDDIADEIMPVSSSDEIRQHSLSERDHTPADYIACGLGMEYVNDKTDLTVRPYRNASESSGNEKQYNDHLIKADQDDSQPQLSRVGGRFPHQAAPNHSQISEATKHDSRAQDLGIDGTNTSNCTGISSDDRENDVNVRRLTSLNGPRVRLPSSPGGLREGPCSPIRQWLKEKEIMETEGIGSNQSEFGLFAKVVDQQTANSTDESPSNVHVGEALSPAMHSQSTTPIRQWLREKQAKEAHECSVMPQDLSAVNSATGSSFIDDGSENLSGMRVIKIPGSMKSPNYPSGQTNSLIPLPVGSRRISDIGKPETKTPSQFGARRRSSSSIPVYKGLSKSSPPKTKELSSAQTSSSTNSHGNPPGADHASHEMMKKDDIGLKKGNQFSKIPIPKVYTALKDGGYLENTQRLTKQSPPQQVSAAKKPFNTISALENSKSDAWVSETKAAKPALEKQGTFTQKPTPILNRDATFIIESEDGNKPGQAPESATQDVPVLSTGPDEKNQASLSPLELVLDHMAKKVGAPSSRKQEAHTTHSGKKRHDSMEETFENSSTESSMSPTTKSVMSKKTPTNLHNTTSYYINAERAIKSQGDVTESKVKERSDSLGTYDRLTESDRIEHNNMDEDELEKIMLTKGQLAEIRNLEIENRHLVYERKEFEAHYIKNKQKHQQLANSSDET